MGRPLEVGKQLLRTVHEGPSCNTTKEYKERMEWYRVKAERNNFAQALLEKLGHADDIRQICNEYEELATALIALGIDPKTDSRCATLRGRLDLKKVQALWNLKDDEEFQSGMAAFNRRMDRISRMHI